MEKNHKGLITVTRQKFIDRMNELEDLFEKDEERKEDEVSNEEDKTEQISPTDTE